MVYWTKSLKGQEIDIIFSEFCFLRINYSSHLSPTNQIIYKKKKIFFKNELVLVAVAVWTRPGSQWHHRPSFFALQE